MRSAIRYVGSNSGFYRDILCSRSPHRGLPRRQMEYMYMYLGDLATRVSHRSRGQQRYSQYLQRSGTSESPKRQYYGSIRGVNVEDPHF